MRGHFRSGTMVMKRSPILRLLQRTQDLRGAPNRKPAGFLNSWGHVCRKGVAEPLMIAKPFRKLTECPGQVTNLVSARRRPETANQPTGSIEKLDQPRT